LSPESWLIELSPESNFSSKLLGSGTLISELGLLRYVTAMGIIKAAAATADIASSKYFTPSRASYIPIFLIYYLQFIKLDVFIS
jgi:hypothetical protein